MLTRRFGLTDQPGNTSSAYDMITRQPVAIKKMMKPFSNSTIAKRTYREVKLLKHLRHENVRLRMPRVVILLLMCNS